MIKTKQNIRVLSNFSFFGLKIGLQSSAYQASIDNNAFTFSNYKGFHPAATSGNAIGGGIDPGFYPVTRQYLVGLNISF